MWLMFSDKLNRQKETIEGRDFISVCGESPISCKTCICALIWESIAYSGNSGLDGDIECCKI